jgi:hypothetical protein
MTRLSPICKVTPSDGSGLPFFPCFSVSIMSYAISLKFGKFVATVFMSQSSRLSIFRLRIWIGAVPTLVI